MTPIEQLQNNVLELQQAMLNAHPQMPTLLQTIHKQLKEDPVNVTLLSEEEIGIVVSGLERITKMELISAMTTGTNKAGKALKKISADDI